MSANIEQAREALIRCRGLREKGAVEAVVRGEFQSRLRSIFPGKDDERWINHYGEGAEAHTKVGTKTGRAAERCTGASRRTSLKRNSLSSSSSRW